MNGIQYWSGEIEKQVGVRVQIVLDDPYLLSVYKKFGADILRRSSVFHGLRKFLNENGVRGKTCFEIGTWNALTSAILSRCFEQVVTVDIVHNPLKLEVIEHLGIKNIRCIDIRNNEQKAALAGDLDFDFAYMDGNHADDTESDWAITKKCGRVLMHEVWPHQKAPWDLAFSLPADEVTHNGMGLALWQGRAK